MASQIRQYSGWKEWNNPFSSWDSLRAAVVEISGMLLRHPKIGDNLKDEVWVIQDFEFFRTNALKTDGVAKVGKQPVNK